MAEQEQQQQNLLIWYNNLQRKEIELIKKQNDLKMFEENLIMIENELDEKLQNNHCSCCKFNNILLNNPDSLYAEWGVFRRVSANSEMRLPGVTSIGEVYLSQTFQNLFDKWKATDVGKEYKDHKLVATYVTKLDLSWSASDWRLVDNPSSKLNICEKSGQNRIKFIIE